MIDRFKQLNPKIEHIKIKKEGDRTIGWALSDVNEELIGYGFYMQVPEAALGMEIAEEFDFYEVTGIVAPDFTVGVLNIDIHPDYDGTVWGGEIIDGGFEKTFIGLGIEEIDLSPEGKIDAISDSTVSSRLVTDAIRRKIEKIQDNF